MPLQISRSKGRIILDPACHVQQGGCATRKQNRRLLQRDAST